MMSAFIVIALCLITGLLFKRFAIFPDNTADVLNRYVIWVALPGLILATIPQLSIGTSALIPMVVAWSILLISAAVVWWVCHQFKWSNSTRCVLLLLVPLGNTSFVGIPLVSALIGEHAILYAILYDQLGSFLALSSYGPLVLAMHGENKVTFSQVSKKVISFPPFIALLVALMLSVAGQEEEFHLAFKSIGATLVPVVMVAVGFQWQFRLPNDERAPMVFGLAFKLLFVPFICWIVLQQFSIDETIRNTVILESGMAPMVSAAALAISHGQKPGLASALVGYGVLLSLITIPMWYGIIH